jgi:hypothetical protein
MKTVIRDLWFVIRGKLWRFALRRARTILDAADDWIHAEEVKLREAAAPAAPPAEFDVKASAARERVHKRAARPRQPRLKYQGGQFVRQS